MERGYAPSRRAPLREPPTSGAFYRSVTLVSGGSGIVGHALIGRILREGGTVIAVRARAAPAPACTRARARAHACTKCVFAAMRAQRGSAQMRQRPR
jgi:NADPH:quinone reductase-like Zn-dependent oxidoreductase